MKYNTILTNIILSDEKSLTLKFDEICKYVDTYTNIIISNYKKHRKINNFIKNINVDCAISCDPGNWLQQGNISVYNPFLITQKNDTKVQIDDNITGVYIFVWNNKDMFICSARGGISNIYCKNICLFQNTVLNTIDYNYIDDLKIYPVAYIHYNSTYSYSVITKKHINEFINKIKKRMKEYLFDFVQNKYILYDEQLDYFMPTITDNEILINYYLAKQIKYNNENDKILAEFTDIINQHTQTNQKRCKYIDKMIKEQHKIKQQEHKKFYKMIKTYDKIKHQEEENHNKIVKEYHQIREPQNKSEQKEASIIIPSMIDDFYSQSVDIDLINDLNAEIVDTSGFIFNDEPQPVMANQLSSKVSETKSKQVVNLATLQRLVELLRQKYDENITPEQKQIYEDERVTEVIDLLFC